MAEILPPNSETERDEKDEETIVADIIEDDEKEPLTTKELRGWYSYIFIPVVLENLAGKAGYELDLVTPCNTTVKNYKCVVKFGTEYVDTSSYSLYIIALSVLFQCFLFIGGSALADHGANRKKFLLFYSYTGAIATGLFSLLLKAGDQSEWYWIAGILTIISNCCYGAAYVFYLAYIPIYSRIHPKVLSLKKTDPSKENLIKTQEEISTSLSAASTSIGFVAGLLVIFIGLGIVLGINSPDFGLQYAISFGGGWWLVGLTAPLLLLKTHPRPPLPSTENIFLYSFKRTFKTILSTKNLWQTMKFLMAWFFLSDGINTIAPLAALFGKVNLDLEDKDLIIIGIVVPLSAAIGVYFFRLIEKVFKLSIKTMILINSFLIIMVPVYALLGFVLPFGLKEKWEVWLFTVYFGLSLGSVQSYCQTLFCRLIPRGHENEFFSLFLITAKGSSWLGPLITGAISSATHDTRSGFWFLAFSLLFPFLIFLTVNVEKGIEDANNFAKNEMEEKA
ncbi:MFS general substrate transporter, partial [Rhizophagus irregularis]|uniref:Autophagy-related protein n=1 Tax=Rhizophagus irregularis TaxID=588596 RepID=A0A2N0SL61_9GLOM